MNQPPPPTFNYGRDIVKDLGNAGECHRQAAEPQERRKERDQEEN